MCGSRRIRNQAYRGPCVSGSGSVCIRIWLWISYLMHASVAGDMGRVYLDLITHECKCSWGHVSDSVAMGAILLLSLLLLSMMLLAAERCWW